MLKWIAWKSEMLFKKMAPENRSIFLDRLNTDMPRGSLEPARLRSLGATGVLLHKTQQWWNKNKTADNDVHLELMFL